MDSKRLLTIASYIQKKDNLIDVGCDHGYLGIYLKKYHLVHNLLLTELRSSALDNAIHNIKENKLEIDTFLTDGLSNIDLNNYDTVSISGMGTKTILTILHPLKKDNNILKVIIQSNNNLLELRTGMLKLGYYLNSDKVVLENNIWYVISEFKKGYQRLNYQQKNFGIYAKDKNKYYAYLKANYQKLLKLIPKKKWLIRINLDYKIKILNQLLKESGTII